jgi:uncharacterized membrane protein
MRSNDTINPPVNAISSDDDLVTNEDNEKVEELLKIFEELPNQDKLTVRTEITTITSGPIPTAEELEKLERASPGAARIIISMAVEEQKHDQMMDSLIVKSDIMSRYIGQFSGFVLSLVLIIGGFILIYNGYDGYGIAVVIGSLATIVISLVLGKYYQDKNKKEG